MIFALAFRRGIPVAIPLLLAVAVASPALIAQEAEAKRYALLVGVNEYEHAKLPALKWAENDATELAALLKKSGYQTVLLSGAATEAKLKPTKANLEARLKEVLRAAGKNDTVLIALAGHGLQFEGQKDAFFCPADARPFKDEADTLVSLGKVYDELDKSFAGVKVLLVDACRDDPNAGRGSRGVDADTAPAPPKGVAALFSCSAGQRAFEHDDLKHGVFFHHVLEGLGGKAKDFEGEVTFNGLSDYVARKVKADVPNRIGGGAKQLPNQKGEFTGGSPVLLAKTVGTPKDKEQAEADFRAYGETNPGAPRKAFLREEASKKLALWKRAAEAGNPAGQDLFARCLYEGIGTEKNERAAVEWFRKAAEAGNQLSMITLGFIYDNGRGVEKDEKEAFKWYKMAAEAGNSTGMNNLGCSYRDGQGVERNYKEAVRWFQKAAEAGNSTGMNNLGSMYDNGRDVEQDEKEAFRWYKKAAEAGDASGMNNLGTMYDSGRGVEKDEKEAFKWYKRAAEAGSRAGMYNLALDYESGTGTEKNEKEALNWYTKAAELGDPDAQKAVERLGKK